MPNQSAGRLPCPLPLLLATHAPPRADGRERHRFGVWTYSGGQTRERRIGDFVLCFIIHSVSGEAIPGSWLLPTLSGGASCLQRGGERLSGRRFAVLLTLHHPIRECFSRLGGTYGLSSQLWGKDTSQSREPFPHGPMMAEIQFSMSGDDEPDRITTRFQILIILRLLMLAITPS